MSLCTHCGSNEFRKDVITGTPINQGFKKTGFDHQRFYWTQVHSDICTRCGQLKIQIHRDEDQ